MLFSSIYRSRVRDVINFVDRVVDRVACQGRPMQVLADYVQ
jgi:hypothetical protein